MAEIGRQWLPWSEWHDRLSGRPSGGPDNKKAVYMTIGPPETQKGPHTLMSRGSHSIQTMAAPVSLRPSVPR